MVGRGRARSVCALVLVSGILVPISVALAQLRGGGGGCPGGGPGRRPPVDCPTACENYANRVKAAALAFGKSEEEAEALAQQARERCLAHCDGTPPQPPEPRATCEERAAAAAARCQAACPEGEECDCMRVFLMTLAACKLREAYVPNVCRAECAKKAAEAYRACRAGGGTRRECRKAANETLAGCLKDCPVPPRTCEERCEALYGYMTEYCQALNDGEAESCRAAAGAIRDACKEACPPRPPVPIPCTRACDRVAGILERLCERLPEESEEKAKCIELLEKFKEECRQALGEDCTAEEWAGRLGFRRFLRGDVRRDRRIDLADAISVLMHLFADAEIECEDAADANDDGALDLGDAVCILQHLFAGGRLPPPTVDEDYDETEDGLGCGEEEGA